jgi:hypothetical protein
LNHGGYLSQPEMRAMISTALGEPMLVWCGNGHACKHGPSGCDEDEWIPLDDHIGVDAFVVSTDNALTGEEPTEDGA